MCGSWATFDGQKHILSTLALCENSSRRHVLLQCFLRNVFSFTKCGIKSGSHKRLARDSQRRAYSSLEHPPFLSRISRARRLLQKQQNCDQRNIPRCADETNRR
ncbi:unnamed protein product [Ixodes pacificus]